MVVIVCIHMEGEIMRLSDQEKELLERLEDGQVGDELTTSGGSTVWFEIQDVVPRQYKEGPSSKFFNGEENEEVPGVLHTLEECTSDSEKIQFLRKYGWLIDDEDAKDYSAEYR